MDYWVKEYVDLNCKYNTIRSYKSIIKNHINPKLGSYKLKSLTPATLQKFVNDLFKYGYSRKTLNLICVVLSEALKTAVNPYKYIFDNLAVREIRLIPRNLYKFGRVNCEQVYRLGKGIQNTF